MKRLILARHSKAENYAESGNDFDRPLSAKGTDFAILQAERFKQKQLFTDLIVSSDALRTKQTATIYREKIGVEQKIIFEHFIYEHYTTQDFLDFMASLPNEKNKVMIVGHNPTIATMASRFANDFYAPVKTGTIIIIDFDIDNWKSVEVGKGKLVEFF